MTVLAAGTLLIAHPMLADPNFMRSVVYLLEFNDAGCLGLICNRPLEMPLSELWEGCPAAVADAKICAEGGPVERDRGLLLHAVAGIPDAHEISEGIFIGGDPAALHAACPDGPGLTGPRLFLGHAGWGAGQLEEEVRTGSWLVRSGHPNLLLHAQPPEDLWKDLVACGHNMPQPSIN